MDDDKGQVDGVIEKKSRLQKYVGLWKTMSKPLEMTFKLIYRKKNVVSEPTNHLLFIPAVDLAEKIRKKEIKSQDVVLAYIDRINEINPVINAMVESCFVQAMDDAKAVDKLVGELSEAELKEKYPLLGVPFTVKEPNGLKGLSFECGITSRKGNKAEDDGAAVKLLRTTGAIPLGVSNVPELCISFETHNNHYGRTLNPYDTSKTPGGSSGGEGALIGGAASLFGIGSDFMGSIRLPAAFTGVFGLRTTSPVISTDGTIPICDNDQVRKLLSFGPLARYAKDLTLIVKVMAGENTKMLTLDKPVDISRLRVFHVPEFEETVEFIKIDIDNELAIAKAVNELRGSGANVQILPKDVKMVHLFEKCISRINDLPRRPMIQWSDIPKEPTVRKGVNRELGRWVFGQSDHTLMNICMEWMIRTKGLVEPDQQKIHMRQVDELEKQLEQLLDDDTVLILPAFPRLPFHHYGIAMCGTGIQFLILPSVMNFPAVTIPMGLNKDGLPLGFQVIAGRFKDHLCIAVAQHFEKVFGGWVPPGSPEK